jgi:hypothetical protein
VRVRDRWAALPLLTAPIPNPTLEPAYQAIKAHPAKAGVAKPRVLASSALLSWRRCEGPQDRRAA